MSCNLFQIVLSRIETRSNHREPCERDKGLISGSIVLRIDDVKRIFLMNVQILNQVLPTHAPTMHKRLVPVPKHE